jgi:hypothetical protein
MDMEQKVPKHRKGNIRDKAEKRRVSHTTIRRNERIYWAIGFLAHTFGETVLDQSNKLLRIRIGQEQFCQWASITLADPEYGRFIFDEFQRHPELSMKDRNTYIRRVFKDMRRASSPPAEPEMDSEPHAETGYSLCNEELAMFRAVVDNELRKRKTEARGPAETEREAESLPISIQQG